RHTEGAGGCRNAAAQEVDLLAPLQKCTKAILDFLLRLQHRILVVDQASLQASILDPHGVGDLSVIEDRPTERGTESELDGSLGEDVGQALVAYICGAGAECTVERECREEIGLGYADLRALRRRVELGTANIRPAPHQVRRDADGNVRRRNRYLFWTYEKRVQRRRRHAEQQTQCVLALPQVRRQLGDRRFRLCEDVLRLIHIKFGCYASLV